MVQPAVTSAMARRRPYWSAKMPNMTDEATAMAEASAKISASCRSLTPISLTAISDR
jgi:hypothetical protein